MYDYVGPTACTAPMTAERDRSIDQSIDEHTYNTYTYIYIERERERDSRYPGPRQLRSIHKARIWILEGLTVDFEGWSS